MNKYSEEFLKKCCDTLVEAEEIQANKELMEELKPVMKEKGQRLMDMEGSLKQKFQAKLNESYKKDDDEAKVKGEKVLAKEEPKLGSKA